MSSATASISATKDSFERTTLKQPNGKSVHLPSGLAKTQFIPTTDVVRIFSANTTGNWSGYSEILLDAGSLPNVVDKFTLGLTMGAGSKTGGTVISLVNDGAFLARLIEVSIGSELISSIYPEAGYIGSLFHETTEDKFKTLPAAGNDTLAHRQRLRVRPFTSTSPFPSFKSTVGLRPRTLPSSGLRFTTKT